MYAAKVIACSRDNTGHLLGNFNPLPSLNTRIYDVMLPDGAVQQYTANQITGNVLSKIDEEGNWYKLVDAILYHYENKNPISVQQSLDSKGRYELTTK